MAGMTPLHQTGSDPAPHIQTLCPHGRHVLRYCERCFEENATPDPGPQPGDFFGDNRAVFEFVQEHGVEAVQCSVCGGRNFNRVITEEWRKEESVDFSDLDEEDPQHYGSVSSAEYHDDLEEDDWVCNSCTHPASRELSNLMRDIEKEPY